MLRKTFLIGCLAIVGFLPVGSASAAILSLVPDSPSVSVGETLTLDVLLTDLAPGEIIAGFDINILYDTILFDTPAATFGDSLGIPNVDTLTLDGPVPGGFNIYEVSFLFDFELEPLQTPSIHPTDGPLPAGTIFLASLSFLASAAGTGVFDIGFFDIADAAFPPGSVPTVGGAAVTVAVSPPVAAVPLPGAVWLMISALLGIGAMTRKRPGKAG